MLLFQYSDSLDIRGENFNEDASLGYYLKYDIFAPVEDLPSIVTIPAKIVNFAKLLQ